MPAMKSPASPGTRPQKAAVERSGILRSGAMLALLCLALAASGCATATFAPVAGDPKPGKMGTRAVVNSCLILPVYSGPPNRPYVVTGIIHAASGSNTMEAARAAVREANQNGADALILLNEYVRRAGKMTTGTSFGLWNAYSRDVSEDWPCPDLGVPPLWRAYISSLPSIYESEIVFAAIRWL
jgi:hypothetical protein